MNKTIIVTGTDTDVGKTVFSAVLAGALKATYWKPVQCGFDEGCDRKKVEALANVKTLPEIYKLALPASPHLAAEAENIILDDKRMILPDVSPLVVEGAGGLMVPLNRKMLYLDLLARWQKPVILCCRTSLGTINHSLLSIAALKKVECPILGLAFIGDENKQVEETICQFANVNRLGRLPFLKDLTGKALAKSFNEQFDTEDIQKRLEAFNVS